MTLAGAGGLLATASLQLPLAAMVLSLFTMVSGVAATTPPSTSLALAHYPEIAGTASSLLGMARFAFGGLAAPLVGLGGAGTALPLGLVTLTCAALAVTVHALTVRSHTRAAQHAVATGWPVDRVTAAPEAKPPRCTPGDGAPRSRDAREVAWSAQRLQATDFRR
ncbi:hypothetical protein ACWC2T_20245 [Streptomyces sp. NPDC001393]